MCWLPGCAVMNSNRLLLGFVLGWILPLDARMNTTLPLNMASDSVDDMYMGCKVKMGELVKNKYFRKENSGPFAKAWKQAESCVNRAMKDKDPKDAALTRDHMQAICVYTSYLFYSMFNDAVRTNRSIYTTSFPFHALHFWLTSAIQILEKKKCETTYRRTKLTFTQKVNQKMRFGFFASSSRDPTLVQFGSKTCFKIETCFGAYLKNYTTLSGKEKEVLIPPYEVFKITGKKKGAAVQELDDCEQVYMLKSRKVLSNLNCAVVN